MTRKQIAYEMTWRILDEMPTCKKEVLEKALDRNLILTSSWVLSSCTLRTYKEGWLIKMEGTRCSFTVFAHDNDGDLIFTRKPNEDTLHFLHEDWFSPNEVDFLNWRKRGIAS